VAAPSQTIPYPYGPTVKIQAVLHESVEKASTLCNNNKAQEWVRVMRSPRRGVDFKTLNWVPVSNLTNGEKKTWDERNDTEEKRKAASENESMFATKCMENKNIQKRSKLVISKKKPAKFPDEK